MDLTDHLRTIGANWWRILLIAIIVGVAVFGFSKSQDNTYRASELVLVAPQLNTPGSIGDAQTLAFKVAAFAQLLRTDSIAQDAVKVGHLKRDYKAVQSSLSLITNSVAGLIDIRSTAHDKAEALATVDALAKALQQNSAAADAARINQNIADDQAAIRRYRTLQKTPGLTADAISQINAKISDLQVDIVNQQAN